MPRADFGHDLLSTIAVTENRLVVSPARERFLDFIGHEAYRCDSSQCYENFSGR